jgi:SAM-dependent methyltransferase
MTDPDVDVRSYMEPEDIAAIGAFEDKHYWHLARRNVILDALPRVGPDDRFLDIGCGPGTATTFFNANGRTVDYADVHAEALNISRERATRELGTEAASRLRFLQLNIVTDPVPTGYAGLLLLDVIEHLPDDLGALQNARASLEPGAHLVLTVPAFPSLWSRFDEQVHHKRRYTLANARAVVDAAGFDIEHSTYFFSPLFVASGTVKLAREARKKAPARFRARDEGLESLVEARTSPMVTKVVGGVLALERPLARRGHLPFGTSVLCVARAR